MELTAQFNDHEKRKQERDVSRTPFYHFDLYFIARMKLKKTYELISVKERNIRE